MPTGSTTTETELAPVAAAHPLPVVLLVAYDRNRAIGKGNALPWHLPDDLKRFKALSLGKPVLMGRRTAESIGRALPGRLNLVMTRSGRAPVAGMQAVSSLDEALQVAQAEGAPELCVIGGAEVDALAMPRAARIHATLVDTQVDGADAFFPPQGEGWRVVERHAHAADERHAFAFEFVDLVREAGAPAA